MKAAALFILFFCVFSAALDPLARIKRTTTQGSFNHKWNATTADKLKRDLMLNYDKFTRPNQDENVTVVTFDPTVNHIELDESRSILTVHCWARITWTDDKLKWDESEYAGLKMLHLADHEIWQPDLIPYNEAEGSAIDVFGNTHTLVSSDGTVLWVPPAAFRVFCDLDLRKWPYDTQKCPLKVGSWTYSGLEISLKYTDTTPSFTNYLQNAEWLFVEMTRERNVVHYACCKEPYIDLVFEMTIKRQSPAYRALILTPITAIVFMTLTTFWLPPASSEKITLGGITALIITLYLLYFTQKLGVMAAHTPYIVSFYSMSLYLVAFSIITSVAIINVASSPRTMDIPWLVKKFMTSRIGQIMLLQNPYQPLLNHQSIRKSLSDDEAADNRPVLAEEINDQPEDQQGSISTTQREWRLLAIILDRTMFLVYCFLFIFFALAYLT